MSEPITLFFGSRILERFELAPEDTHHAVRVLRHKKGDIIWCIDGSGSLFGIQLDKTGSRTAGGTIVSERHAHNEPPLETTLVCGLTLVSRMDWLIEKATELGVTTVRPVEGRRHVGPGRIKRWERMARSAAKQCRRGRIPDICAPAPLDAILSDLPGDSLRLLADASGGALPFPGPKVDRVVVAVGPDIGFSTDERKSLLQNGFRPVSLGARRLRTETAAVAILVPLVTCFQAGTTTSGSSGQGEIA